MSPAMTHAIERVGRLLDDEAELRVEARRLELDPARGREARHLFHHASALRRERLEIVDRCGLTR